MKISKLPPIAYILKYARFNAVFDVDYEYTSYFSPKVVLVLKPL